MFFTFIELALLSKSSQSDVIDTPAQWHILGLHDVDKFTSPGLDELRERHVFANLSWVSLWRGLVLQEQLHDLLAMRIHLIASAQWLWSKRIQSMIDKHFPIQI